MDPVSRPEWASPLVVGKHVREFLSALPKNPTQEVLSSLSRDYGMLSLLERHPLSRVELSGRLPQSWNGQYDRLLQDLTVDAFRPPETYGEEFIPGKLASVSEAGRNLAEAMQRSLYHELGHHVLEIAGPDAQRHVERLLRNGRALPVSLRARKRGVEHFSETLAAYRFEDSLADKDPEGYDMVEAVLRLVGKK